jgi:hypothetical protein
MTGLMTRARRVTAAALLLCSIAVCGCSGQSEETTTATPDQKIYIPPHPVPYPSGLGGTHATQP